MKRFSTLIVMLALVLSGLVFVAPTASAKKADRRPCVSKAEFRQVHRPMTTAQVTSIFDAPGYEIARFVNRVYDGYWDSTYVANVVYDSYDWNGDGIITPDETERVDLGYWVDDWVDTSYNETDTIRTYFKCRARNFDRGRGRVAINFDDYSSDYAGLRVYSKFRNNPWTQYARMIVTTKDHGVDKTRENTPAPHRKLKDTVVKP